MVYTVSGAVFVIAGSAEEQDWAKPGGEGSTLMDSVIGKVDSYATLPQLDSEQDKGETDHERK